MKYRYLVFLILASVTAILSADDTKFDLGSFEIDIDSKLRLRTAFLNEFYPEDLYLMADTKGEVSVEISNDSPFYFNSLFELGNIELDEDFEAEDLTELEIKELYMGFDNGFTKSKVGIIDVKTPGKYVYSGEDAGLQLKFDLEPFELKGFYTSTNLIDDELELKDSDEELNHLAYLGIERNSSYEYDIWAMYYDDNSQDDIDYFCAWLGWEGKKEFGNFDSDFGFTYNSGMVTENEEDYMISAYFTHGRLAYSTTDSTSVFVRFNATSGDDPMGDSINQFQSVDGEGNLDTSLGLLFGGSPYSSISYFTNESLSIVSDNLSDGYLSMSEPGLIVYEAGFNFAVESIDYEGQFVVGGANVTSDDYDSTFIGLEFDLHNQYKVNDYLSVALSLAYLIPGDAITSLYYSNESEILDDVNSFKADCSFILKF